MESQQESLSELLKMIDPSGTIDHTRYTRSNPSPLDINSTDNSIVSFPVVSQPSLSVDREWDVSTKTSSSSSTTTTATTGTGTGHPAGRRKKPSSSNTAGATAVRSSSGTDTTTTTNSTLARSVIPSHWSLYDRFNSVEMYWTSLSPHQRRQVMRAPIASMLQVANEQYGDDGVRELCEGLTTLYTSQGRNVCHWRCPACNVRLPSAKDFREHVAKFHEEVQFGPDDVPLSCVKCFSEIVGTHYLKTNSSSVNGGGEYMCIRCAWIQNQQGSGTVESQGYTLNKVESEHILDPPLPSLITAIPSLCYSDDDGSGTDDDDDDSGGNYSGNSNNQGHSEDSADYEFYSDDDDYSTDDDDDDDDNDDDDDDGDEGSDDENDDEDYTSSDEDDSGEGDLIKQMITNLPALNQQLRLGDGLGGMIADRLHFIRQLDFFSFTCIYKQIGVLAQTMLVGMEKGPKDPVERMGFRKLATSEIMGLSTSSSSSSSFNFEAEQKLLLSSLTLLDPDEVRYFLAYGIASHGLNPLAPPNKNPSRARPGDILGLGHVDAVEPSPLFTITGDTNDMNNSGGKKKKKRSANNGTEAASSVKPEEKAAACRIMEKVELPPGLPPLAGNLHGDEFVEVQGWWLNHLVQKGWSSSTPPRMMLSSGGPSSDSTTNNNDSVSGNGASEKVVLQWLYGNIGSASAEALAERQRLACGMRDPENVLIDVLAEVADSWRHLAESMERKRQLITTKMRMKKESARVRKFVNDSGPQLMTIFKQSSDCFDDLIKRLDSLQNRDLASLSAALADDGDDVVVDSSKKKSASGSSSGGDNDNVTELTGHILSKLQQFVALKEETAIIYAQALVDRDVAIMEFAELIRRYEVQAEIQEESRVEDSLFSAKLDLETAEAEAAKIESEGPAAFKRRDFLDRVNKEADFRQRLIEADSHRESCLHQVETEELYLQSAKRRREKAEQELDLARQMLEENRKKREELITACTAVLEAQEKDAVAAMHADPEKNADTYLMVMDAEVLQERIFSVLDLMKRVVDIINQMHARYDPAKRSAEYEKHLRVISISKGLTEELDDRIKAWYNDLQKHRRRAVELACVDCGQAVEGAALEVVRRKLEQGAAAAREAATMDLLRELEEEEEAKKAAESKKAAKKKKKKHQQAKQAQEVVQKEVDKKEVNKKSDDANPGADNDEEEEEEDSDEKQEDHDPEREYEEALERRRKELEAEKQREEEEMIRKAREASLREKEEAAQKAAAAAAASKLASSPPALPPPPPPPPRHKAPPAPPTTKTRHPHPPPPPPPRPTTTTTTTNGQGTMKVVTQSGDWICRCNRNNKLWDACVCGQSPPCRDWVRGQCVYKDKCRFAHPPFAIPTTTTATTTTTTTNSSSKEQEQKQPQKPAPWATAVTSGGGPAVKPAGAPPPPPPPPPPQVSASSSSISMHPSTQQPLDVISQYNQQQQQYVIGAGGLFNTEMTSVSSPHHSATLFGPDSTIGSGGSLLGITNQPPTAAIALFGTGNHSDQLSPPQQRGGGLLMMGTGSPISQPSLFGNNTATGNGNGGGLLFGNSNSNGGGYGGGGLDDWSDLQAVLPADLGAEVLGVGMSHHYEQQQQQQQQVGMGQLHQQQQPGSSFLASDGTAATINNNNDGDGSTNQRNVGGLFTGHSLW
jgi:hypothetical protein